MRLDVFIDPTRLKEYLTIGGDSLIVEISERYQTHQFEVVGGNIFITEINKPLISVIKKEVDALKQEFMLCKTYNGIIKVCLDYLRSIDFDIKSEYYINNPPPE